MHITHKRQKRACNDFTTLEQFLDKRAAWRHLPACLCDASLGLPWWDAESWRDLSVVYLWRHTPSSLWLTQYLHVDDNIVVWICMGVLCGQKIELQNAFGAISCLTPLCEEYDDLQKKLIPIFAVRIRSNKRVSPDAFMNIDIVTTTVDVLANT